MKFCSTQNRSETVSFKQAVLQGMPEDKGLYMPVGFPVLRSAFIESLQTLSFHEICLEIATLFLSEDVQGEKLLEVIVDALDFDAPIVLLKEKLYVLELFHGPTLSFKDFGARFMARLLSYVFLEEKEEELHILVATSGDTGSAVGRGFFDVPGICVKILYPKDKITWIQEKQITTMGQNVTAIEVDGTFDDCQRLVKGAFLDEDLRKRRSITSANSINIARLMPQIFYYFYAYSQLQDLTSPLLFSVPSGNFGNLSAGLIAKRIGLPVDRFIAATNINRSVPNYLKSGKFEPHASIKTLSNAMDVGDPSNFGRMLDLYGQSQEKMCEDIYGTYFSDDETKVAIKELFEVYHYLSDPHGAVGYLGLKQCMERRDDSPTGIYLATAHPAKFLEEVQPLVSTTMHIPERLQHVLKQEKQAYSISSEYGDFKALLLSL